MTLATIYGYYAVQHRYYDKENDFQVQIPPSSNVPLFWSLISIHTTIEQLPSPIKNQHDVQL